VIIPDYTRPAPSNIPQARRKARARNSLLPLITSVTTFSGKKRGQSKWYF